MSEHARPLQIGLDVTAVPSDPVGAGRYSIEIARALADRSDVTTTLFSRRADRARWDRLRTHHLESLRIVANAPRSRPLRLVYAEFGLGREARRVQPELEVFHGPHYQMPRALLVPAVVTVHDLTFVEHPEWHERSKVALFRRAMKYSAAHAAVIICVSRHTAERFEEHFHPAAEVRVITHGVDHARFHRGDDPVRDDGIIQTLGIHAPYLVHVGTLEPRKNIPNLIRAFDLIAARHRDLSLVLAGQLAWGRDELMRAIGESRYADRIIQLGYIRGAAVAPLLRRAVVVAYPSIEEGFGLPALEALACGAPLVTTERSVMAEIAGDAATYVEPDDVTALAEALLEIIAGGSTVNARRELGIMRAREFTWARSAELHVEAYRRALDR
ncbi:MAG TPA: glycosyltransferase family 1 protein [Acidimicrobiales bacterium]|nr:glycosyltransferase family 1 protein [Acidimicrobiales bacterium]